MFISEKEQFIFLHPMKTGGLTTRSRLRSYGLRTYPWYNIKLIREKTEEEQKDYRQKIRSWKSKLFSLQKQYQIWHQYHFPYQLLSDNPDIIPPQFYDYFKFTFVRNPYDRMYSFFLQLWHHIKKILKIPELQSIAESNQTTSGQITKFRTKAERINKKTADDALSAKYFKPITAWYEHPEFKVRNIPYKNTPLYLYTHDQNGQNKMDFIGRLENYEQDYHRLIDLLKLDQLQIPIYRDRTKINRNIRNKTEDKQGCYKYLEHYDQEALDFVNHHYQKDFEMFKYRMIKKVEDISKYIKSCPYLEPLV